MTPKEKARELLGKFDYNKEYALKAVDEIVDVITGGEPDWTGKTIFWQEVKNEINNL